VCIAFANETVGCGSHTTCVVDDVMAQDIYILTIGYNVFAGNYSLMVSATVLPPKVCGGGMD